MAPRRPTAFEVSFPNEVTEDVTMSGTGDSGKSYHSDYRSPSTSLGKRRADGPSDVHSAKRRELPKGAKCLLFPGRVGITYFTDAYYKRRKNEIIEDENLVIEGEDPDPEDGDDEKPIRELHGFCIFDPKHRNELVTLEELEQDDGLDREFEAAGIVSPYFLSDEDEGQEDESEENQFVHLSAILRFTVDYTQDTEPFYIETQYAWYILKTPSNSYQPFYKHFYSPRRIAQMVVSRALNYPQESFQAFSERFTSKVDMFDHTYIVQDLWDSATEIQEAILDNRESQKIMNVPFVKKILQRAPLSTDTARRRPTQTNGPRMIQNFKNYNKSKIDLEVLKNENQNPTCVTPGIAKLSEGLFRERLMVVGSPPAPINKAEEEARKAKAFTNLRRLIAKTKKTKKAIDYRKDDRISVHSGLYKAVKIDGQTYSIGDVVLLPNPARMSAIEEKKLHPDPDSRIDHFFWFARIIYIMIETQTVHVQWFNHGSETVIGELANPQELFLSELCGHESLHGIVGKATVHMRPHIPSVDKPEEYFCKFMHEPRLGSFTSIDLERLKLFSIQSPPNNCSVCPLVEIRDLEIEARELKDDFGILNGVAFAGTRYHLEDFVLYRAEKGPANIGYVISIEFSKKRPVRVTMRKVGRIADLGDVLPENVVKDERHLFLTEEEVSVDVKELLQVVYVPSKEFGLGATKDLWAVKIFVESKHRKLQTLDVFGGVGAFSRGIAEGSGCLQSTHSIEIGPSAAMTLQHNHPEMTVYNQCANEMLRYIIKSQSGHHVDTPKQNFDGKTPVPRPPKQDEIDSHSSLNMYKHADDIKSNLILTTLSYMDYFSPSFGYFENVPGFLKFSLNATQANRHQVKGGIDMGGLKLVIRALIDMNYQVRFALLQAAHYGTPQRRVRFFLVAAKHDKVLPELPQPTHDFPDSKIFTIKYDASQDPISPIRMAHGTALHPVVTIEDAIGDLPRFDWKHPRPNSEKFPIREQRKRRQRSIPSIECKTSEPYCGFTGQIGYHMDPKTRYQQTARLVLTQDIQQYTKCLLPSKIERVLNIPMEAGADYKSLPPTMHQWQSIDPTSAVGKHNYKSGMYARLDGQGTFSTTVTNVDPTAKQSRVLHPWCHRMLTVRELARSQGFPDDFIFKAIEDNVVTMHRQIGNAVPIPLAHALGRELRESLFKQWIALREEAIIVDDN
ncbi:S-adenosyl-L-methionine-dependent methyltransferase [Gymnopilus junonius]|uniref:DNA (cytosine-5-)-methyltransferase n=1 Tax=Gymnopilus junonius TaxID=109634 RepID=A0A9P5TTH5_GYMJU|nr:S-adenosyl-L-methionine-dependent methyltransferase [Gymnopilus junonius]